MASSATEHHLPLLILLSLLLLTHARLNLDRSDHKTFSIIQKDLRVNCQSSPSTTPCNTPGVFCERRLSSNHTYVLRITRITFKSLRLAGFLSPAIGRLTELKELSLPNNQLVGRIPAQLLKCKKLEILDLGSNSFLGEVPSELSILVRLQILDLSSNQFSGKLGFLKHFPNLEILNLADNLFTGKVPKSIRSFRNLQFFDFSGNRFLEGQVPVMSKAESSVSQYPKRYIFAENKTPNASKNGPSSALAPATSNAQGPTSSGADRKHKNKKKKLGAWILGFLAGAAAGCLSGFVFSVIFKLALSVIRGGGKGTGVAIFSSIIKKEEDLAFLEKEDGLTGLECIGSGGCGQVFRAELPDSNGKIIAIKKILRQPKDAAELSEEETHHMNIMMRQIRSEIKTVGQIRHRNLLPLLAHVSRPDCHLLVYEFMKNGSLHDVLTQVAQGTREFDWLARHKVALGIASGLEYLHVSHGTQIIHRDLKPANILLDDDMEARIADFGLAKTMPDGNTHMTASNVAGTKGYIAPEYHQTLKLTEKSDIFSFGVILGGLVMGKSPSDEFFQHTDEMYMMKWLKNVMTSENPSQAIDSKLMGNGYEEQMLLVLKIAVFCTADDPKQRPNSKEVRCMLEQIKH